MKRAAIMVVLTLINSLVIGISYNHSKATKLHYVKVGEEFVNEVIKVSKKNKEDILTTAKTLIHKYPKITKAVILLDGKNNKTYKAEVVAKSYTNKPSYAMSVFKPLDEKATGYVGVLVEVCSSIDNEIDKINYLMYLFIFDILILIWLLISIVQDKLAHEKAIKMIEDMDIADFSFILNDREE
jgi:hypothetical protein